MVDFFSELNFKLTDGQREQLHAYYEMVIKKNKVLNLTSITNEEEFYIKHFVDSLIIANYDKELQTQPLKLVDVGTGAGFPGIPLKIAFPNLQITLLDSSKKRLVFIDEAIQQLQLAGIQTIHSRVEDFGHDNQFRQQFDRATARAVAKTNVLVEYLLPLIQINGKIDLLKSTSANEELFEAKNALQTLGGQLEEEFSYQLPNNDPRTLQVIQKTKKTPNKYPRKSGTPAKQPL